MENSRTKQFMFCIRADLRSVTKPRTFLLLPTRDTALPSSGAPTPSAHPACQARHGLLGPHVDCPVLVGKSPLSCFMVAPKPFKQLLPQSVVIVPFYYLSVLLPLSNL